MTGTVGILAKTGSREITAAARRVYQTVLRLGLVAIPDENLAKEHRLPGGKSIGKMKVDLLVTVGGDGTVLKAVREMPDSKTPILGVNMGRRGYLTQVDPDRFEDTLQRWVHGKFQLEKLWKLSVIFGSKSIGEGLNEALLTPTLPAKMLSLEISLEGRSLYRARADGLIVATPTGSTAHAFSSGGPILESSLDNFTLTFIAPLQQVRSMVVHVKSGLRVRIGTPGPDANLSVDGQLRRSIKAGQTLSFKKSSKNISFVRFDDTFLQRSMRRLAPEREAL